MLIKEFLISVLLFFLGHILVWIQLNGQFSFPDFFKKYEWGFILMGAPLGYLFIKATEYGYSAFNGILWPQRLIGFSIGIIIFSFLTHTLLNEGLSTKTLICLSLSFTILAIQIFWK